MESCRCDGCCNPCRILVHSAYLLPWLRDTVLVPSSDRPGMSVMWCDPDVPSITAWRYPERFSIQRMFAGPLPYHSRPYDALRNPMDTNGETKGRNNREKLPICPYWHIGHMGSRTKSHLTKEKRNAAGQRIVDRRRFFEKSFRQQVNFGVIYQGAALLAIQPGV